jgi:hypothetical protein
MVVVVIIIIIIIIVVIIIIAVVHNSACRRRYSQYDYAVDKTLLFCFAVRSDQRCNCLFVTLILDYNDITVEARLSELRLTEIRVNRNAVEGHCSQKNFVKS